MNDNKISFIVYGVFFLILPAIQLGDLLINGAPLPWLTFYSLITVAVMSFCFAYLAPNFGRNDQQDKRRIIRRSIITGFVVLFISIAIALPLVALNLFEINFFHLLLILLTILVSAGFISAVVYSKRNIGQNAHS